MPSWLVTGATGMLGTDLVELLRARGERVTALGHKDLDITEPRRVSAVVAGHEVVVNLAAWTDVDGAETNEPQALRVNAAGPALLARACRQVRAQLVQVSTDYVFPGDAHAPYAENGEPDPVNAYGRTKHAGEVAVRRLLPGASYVVRTSWLYGAHGPNFVTTMARLAAKREHLDVVDDQHGQPTWTFAVARRLVDLVTLQPAPGVYHATAAGVTTWHGLARAVFEELGLDPARVRPTTSEAFPRPAPRPSYSVLGDEAGRAAGLDPMSSWRDALAAAAPVMFPQRRFPSS